MGVATGFTAERMLEIENTTITSGFVDIYGNLLLKTREGVEFDAGHVKGPQGDKGDKGEQGDQGVPGGASFPAGIVLMWTSDILPPNWAWCDGGESSRIEDASLFAAIGTIYGPGDGVTTFNRPDFRETVPVGYKEGSLEFGELGGFFGAKTVPHNHPLSDNGQAQVNTGGSGVLVREISGSWTATRLARTSSPPEPSTAARVSAAALMGTTDSSSVSVIQPSRVVNFIIKTSNGDTPGDSQLTQRVSNLEAGFNSLSTSGLVPIIPSGNPQNATVDENGLFTFSGADWVGINYIFSSKFRSYRVVLGDLRLTGNFGVEAWLRNGTTSQTTGYDHAQSTSVTNASVMNASAWQADGGMGANYHSGTMDIFDPFLSVATRMSANIMARKSDGISTASRGGLQRTNSPFDGLRFTPTSGTISGWIKVYGYN